MIDYLGTQLGKLIVAVIVSALIATVLATLQFLVITQWNWATFWVSFCVALIVSGLGLSGEGK